jgi:hypothetical protein
MELYFSDKLTYLYFIVLHFIYYIGIVFPFIIKTYMVGRWLVHCRPISWYPQSRDGPIYPPESGSPEPRDGPIYPPESGPPEPRDGRIYSP